MASTTFAVALGFRAGCGISENRQAAFALSAGVLVQADPYNSGTSFSRNRGDNKAWLPPPREPVLNADGTMRPSWYRFFEYVANRRLGGIAGPSMNEVQANVVETKVQAVNAVVAAASVEQALTTNAEALKATIQVAQNAGLAGASNIPEVVLRPSSTSYLEP